MIQLLKLVMEFIDKKNISYGDARIGNYHWQNIFTRDGILTNLSNRQSTGIGIRIYNNGAWGFFSTPDLSRDGVITAAEKALEIANASALTLFDGSKFSGENIDNVEWITPYKIDPFTVSINEKIDYLLQINGALDNRPEIKQTTAMMFLGKEHKLFMNSEGSSYDQLIMRVFASASATAVSEKGFETRTYSVMPLNTGYEHISDWDILDEAPRISGEAVQKLNSDFCPHETTDLILMPNHTALTIHETIGHATELDRVMGWEADMAGTSFATIDKMNKLRYGSPIFNVIADRTLENGRSTVAMDDEGVIPDQWHLIKDGMLNGYATTRSTAHFVGELNSRGCSYADSWSSLPILRMPNVSIEPGKINSPSLAELIEDTKHGVLVDGMGSFSIDHQRINFQFGGDCAWRIENGEKKEILRRFTYQSKNPVFWNSVDAICNKDEWQPYGVVNCGKGQPMQVAQLTHGSSPLRLKKISIGRAKI